MASPSYIYNLGNIRDEVFNLADWAPSNSAEAIHRVNQLVNRAVFRMANDAPWLFEVNDYRIAVEPNIQKKSPTDLLQVSNGDRWVLEGALLSTDANAQTWQDNREWGGRILMIQDPDDTEMWHEFRIREVWTDSDPRTQISLDRPWQHATTTNLNWNVITAEMVIPEDIIELRSAVMKRGQLDYPLEVVGQDIAERSTITNRATNIVTGIPRWMYRREPQSLRQPNYTPVVSELTVEAGGGWVGPEPGGIFEYCYTYVWGKHEDWLQYPGPKTQAATAGDADRHLPYWESAPSPISASAEIAATGSRPSLNVSLPDIDFMLGFGDAGTQRYHRAGIKKRIYRRRSKQNLPSPAPTRLDFDNRFYLIGEADGHDLGWQDNGSQTPDYNAPLRNVQRYETIGFYPHPDKRYEVTLRAVAKPSPLVGDTDVPPIPSDAVDCLIYRTLMYLYESMGNAAMKENARVDYERALYTLQKRHGSLRPAQRVRRRRTARVRRQRTYFANEPLTTDL